MGAATIAATGYWIWSTGKALYKQQFQTALWYLLGYLIFILWVSGVLGLIFLELTR